MNGIIRVHAPGNGHSQSLMQLLKRLHVVYKASTFVCVIVSDVVFVNWAMGIRMLGSENQGQHV